MHRCDSWLSWRGRNTDGRGRGRRKRQSANQPGYGDRWVPRLEVLEHRELLATFGTEYKRVAEDASSFAEFGTSVALGDSLAVVGAPGDGARGERAGAAYVFSLQSADSDSFTNWQQQDKLLPDDPSAEDHFGYSVAMSGSTIVVGSPLDDELGMSSGSADVFEPSSTGWSQFKLRPGTAVRFAVATLSQTTQYGAIALSAGPTVPFRHYTQIPRLQLLNPLANGTTAGVAANGRMRAALGAAFRALHVAVREDMLQPDGVQTIPPFSLDTKPVAGRVGPWRNTLVAPDHRRSARPDSGRRRRCHPLLAQPMTHQECRALRNRSASMIPATRSVSSE